MGALTHNYLFLYTFFFHVHLFFGVANIHIIIIIISAGMSIKRSQLRAKVNDVRPPLPYAARFPEVWHRTLPRPR